MQKNVAGQKLTFFAFNTTTNAPVTGDAANITPYLSKDDGAVTALTDTSLTEYDATNAKGYYHADISQTETNADKLLPSAKSSTANVVVIAVPGIIYTTPASFTSFTAPAAALVAFFGADWAAGIATLMATTVDGVALSTVLTRIYAGSVGRRDISGTDPYTIECYGPGGTIIATITATAGGGTVIYA